MYGIIFELEKNPISELKNLLESIGLKQVQENFYITKDKENGLTTLYKAIKTLSNDEFFKDAVQDIRAFRIEVLSNFTDIVKNGI